MLNASNVLAISALVATILWLGVPQLLLPTLAVALGVLSVSRWRREGRKPMAAERYRVRLLATAIMIGVIGVPLIVRLVPPNGAYGFRTSATHSNVDVWYSANAFMGWALLAGAVVSSIGLAYIPETTKRGWLLAVFLLPLLGAVVASFACLDRLT